MRVLRIISALLFVLIISGTAAAFSYDEVLADLKQLQIVDVIPENPDEYVTREVFCVTLSKAVSVYSDTAPSEVSGPLVFEDAHMVSDENYRHFMHLYEEKILRGAEVGGKLYIQPEQFITRQDAAVLLGRWLGINPSGDVIADVTFSDDGDISGYSKSTVYQLYNMEIISGYPEGDFKPRAHISFVEMSALLHKTLKSSLTGVITYVGSGIMGNKDGLSLETRLAMPYGVCANNDGEIIIFDTYNAGVKRVKNGKTETILGFSSQLDDYGFVKPLYTDGSRESALFGRPVAGVHTQSGDLFIVDSENNAIRLLRGDTVYTFAGGTEGFADGKNRDAKFNSPSAIAIDKDGNLLVADTQNHCIRKIAADGTVSTIAGKPEQSGFADGSANSALFYEPSGIAVGENGVIYIADTGNHVIRKLENGVVTTLAGAAEDIEEGEDYAPGGFTDGTARSAQFRFPRGLCYAQDVLYIADTGNHSIRAVSKDGTVSTIAGSGVAGDVNGSPAVSMMNKPISVAYSGGALYVADSVNNKIKLVRI